MSYPQVHVVAIRPARCSGAVSRRCNQEDVRLTVLGLRGRPVSMCSACREVADGLGIPVRLAVDRGEERRRSRFALPFERDRRESPASEWSS
jgi:hypothetical protein